MQVIKSTKTYYCDVDETLLLFNSVDMYPQEALVAITDPASGITTHAFPHKRHIELMRQMKARGYTVVVWSAGGHEWAARAVRALGIEKMVDVVIGKPDWFCDDLPASSYMKKPIYLHPTDPLKDERAQEITDEE